LASSPIDDLPASFYLRRGKRLLDLALSLSALILLLPVFVLISAIIRLTSPGPALFKQERIGKVGHPFQICKFRSMHVNSENSGLPITSKGDHRITAVGAVLRKYKLDELPQLWNVVKGEMSLVGPRPEIRKYVDLYNAEQKRVLSLLPGITSPASLEYRREEELLSQQYDPERYYIDHLLDQKIRINQDYASALSLKNDLRILFATVTAALRPDHYQA